MGRSHGKGTSFFLAMPPREWGQILVKHVCLSTGQRVGLSIGVINRLFINSSMVRIL